MRLRKILCIPVLLLLTMTLVIGGCKTSDLVSSDAIDPSSSDYDDSIIAHEQASAQPIDESLSKQLLKNGVPTAYDLSKYITYTENQDGFNDCVERSLTQLMNMQNEAYSPYSPDFSVWYLRAKALKFKRARDFHYMDNYASLLQDVGDCPEAYVPTDYDKVTLLNGKNKNYSLMPLPTAENDQEAAYYKVVSLSQPTKTDKNMIKHLMMQYGPVSIAGDIPNVSKSHAMVIIGWDDKAEGGGAFKLLNSWGDHWGPLKDGTCWLTYADFDAGANNFHFHYIKNKLSDRTGTPAAYTARISLEGAKKEALRNGLTISVFAAGQAPWVFWDCPNHLKEHCYDNSQNLCLDIPLPNYAAANWFDSPSTQWTIQVNNHNSGAVTLKEFTVARQDKNANGSYSVETYSSGQAGAEIAGGSSASFTINGNAKKVVLPVYTQNPFSLKPS